MPKIYATAIICMLVSNPLFAQQVTTETVAPGSSVTTTVESPTGTTVTQVTSTGHSAMTHLRDGTRIEMDSDGSVYKVYDDGSRVAEEDGVHTLIDGSNITVKDGIRIP